MRIILEKLFNLENFSTSDINHFLREGKSFLDQTNLIQTLQLNSEDEKLLSQLFALKLIQGKIGELSTSLAQYDSRSVVYSVEDPWLVRLKRNEEQKLKSSESQLKSIISAYGQENGQENSANRIRTLINAVNILFVRLRGRRNLKPGDPILVKWEIELKTRLAELGKRGATE